MPRSSPIQTDFGTGEISPMVMGRVDADRYKSALEKCENFIPTAQGALVRRSGTMFIDEVKDSTKRVRLVPFEFSTDQAYVLEFGDNYIRFFANYGFIPDPVTPADHYELASPYTEAMLDGISWQQIGDVLYIVHQDYPVTKLSRFDDDDWTLENADLLDGPYMDTYTITYAGVRREAAFTSSADGYTGTIGTFAGALTASSANQGNGITRVTVTTPHVLRVDDYVSIFLFGVFSGPYKITNVVSTTVFDIDYGTYFAFAGVSLYGAPFGGLGANPAGRKIRILYGSDWVWGTVVSPAVGPSFNLDDFASGKAVRFITETNFGASDVTTFRFGLYHGVYGLNGSNGYPTVVTVHEDRLVFGGCPAFPQRVDMSKSSDYENFAPTDPDGTVVSDSAVAFSLNQGGVDKIQWLTSDEKGLLIGTAGAEYWARGSTQYEAISATNLNVKRSTSFGSSDVAPVQAGKGTMFIQRSGRKLREMAFFYDVDGFRATDMSILAEHITQGGVSELAFQREPNPIVWAIRDDGALLGCSYDRDLDALRAGWHRHFVGGVSDAGGTSAIVESITVIPSPDTSRYDLWLSVQRWIDGQTFRSIEYLTRIFEDSVDQEDGFFVDCGLTYDGVPNDTISGLDHLEGETVSICGDGSVYADQVVASGAVTLAQECSVVHVGLPFVSEVKLLRLESGSADGTSIGKKRRMSQVSYMLNRTAAFKHGTDFDNLDQLTFRTSSDPLNEAVPLFTGIKEERIEGTPDTESQICIRQDQPLPLMLLAVMPQLMTEGKG